MGFMPNLYDHCVVNKIIEGKQCTIGWHVDDIKISHQDPQVNDNARQECVGTETMMGLEQTTLSVWMTMG